MASEPPPWMSGSTVPPGPAGGTNPYAVGQAGASSTAGDGTTSAAGAHYLPGSPAVAPTGANANRRPGLVALAALLVLGSLAWLVWHAVTWFEPLVQALDDCQVERGMACFTGEPFQRWLYAPVLAVVLAWGFASGAATEGRQGRVRGYLYVLAGVAVLVGAGLVGSR